jgi:hypothetical protein
MKPGFYLLTLKPKSNQSSGYTYTFTKQSKSLNKRLPARKLMAAVFWHKKLVLMVFIKQGTTEVYCRTLKKLHRVIQNKRCGMLTSSVQVVLLHDNVCSHAAACTWTMLKHFNWALLDHPPNSPDLTPNGYHLFTYLKNWLGPQHFNNNKE